MDPVDEGFRDSRRAIALGVYDVGRDASDCREPDGVLRRDAVAIGVEPAALQRILVVAHRGDGFQKTGVIGLDLGEAAGDGSLTRWREHGSEPVRVNLVAEAVAADVEGMAQQPGVEARRVVAVDADRLDVEITGGADESVDRRRRAVDLLLSRL